MAGVPNPFVRKITMQFRKKIVASPLKKSNVSAIVLCHAPRELAQDVIAFPVVCTACSSRCCCGYYLQAPLAPRVPMLFRLRTLRDCRFHCAVRVVFDSQRDRGAVRVCLLRHAVAEYRSAFWSD